MRRLLIETATGKQFEVVEIEAGGEYYEVQGIHHTDQVAVTKDGRPYDFDVQGVSISRVRVRRA